MYVALFAVLLDLFLRENGPIFDHTHLMSYLLEENDYRYHLVAHDPRI